MAFHAWTAITSSCMKDSSLSFVVRSFIAIFTMWCWLFKRKHSSVDKQQWHEVIETSRCSEQDSNKPCPACEETRLARWRTCVRVGYASCWHSFSHAGRESVHRRRRRSAGNCGNRNGRRRRCVSVCGTKRVRCVARLRLHIRSRNTTHLQRRINRATFRSGLHPSRLRLLIMSCGTDAE